MKDILNIKGVKTLSKKQKKAIAGGHVCNTIQCQAGWQGYPVETVPGFYYCTCMPTSQLFMWDEEDEG